MMVSCVIMFTDYKSCEGRPVINSSKIKVNDCVLGE